MSNRSTLYLIATAAAVLGYVSCQPAPEVKPAPIPAPIVADPEQHRAAAPTPARKPAPVAATPSAQGRVVIRYEMPDGVVGFTDDEKRVPAKATRVVRGYRAADGRWTYVGPGTWKPQSAFRPAPPNAEEGVWRAAQRRAEERLDAARAAARAFPGGDLGAGLEQRVQDAQRGLERLEDECRRSRACEPGYLR